MIGESRTRRILKELDEKTKAYPFKATAPVGTGIDPKRLGDGHTYEGAFFMRTPLSTKINLWHFKAERARDAFIQKFEGVEKHEG